MYRKIDKFFLCGAGFALVFIAVDLLVRLGNIPDNIRQDQHKPLDHNKIERLLNTATTYDEKQAIWIFYPASEKPESDDDKAKSQDEKDVIQTDRVVKLVSIAKSGDDFYAYGLVSTGDNLDTKRLKKGDVVGNEVVMDMNVDSITLSSSTDQSSRVLYIFSTKDQASSKG